MSRLLIDESVLVVIPSLAKAVGLSEAIILQQVHYWLMNKKVGKWARKDGQALKWVRNTHEEWASQFSWWSARHVRRLMKGLVDSGLLLTRADLNQKSYDGTLWWSLDYGKLEEVVQAAGATDHLEDDPRTPYMGDVNGQDPRGGQIVHPPMDRLSTGDGQEVHQPSSGQGGQDVPDNTIDKESKAEESLYIPQEEEDGPPAHLVRQWAGFWTTFTRTPPTEEEAIRLAQLGPMDEGMVQVVKRPGMSLDDFVTRWESLVKEGV